MQKGWQAAGVLLPLWQRYPGKRDGLAAAVGTTGATLSAINSGKRNLGHDLGSRLAAELGVTVLDLGAPAEAEPESRTLYGLLEELRADGLAERAELLSSLRSIASSLREIERRLDSLAHEPRLSSQQSAARPAEN